jgi:hypothetical protein
MFSMEPFRPVPKMPPQLYKTYAIKQPLATHWRNATCAEVDCPRYLRGWQTVLGMADQDGQNAAAWIRSMSGLKFTEEITGPQQVTFRFPAGQLCPHSNPAHPKRHKLPLGRPPVLLMRHGDHRGNPDGTQRLFRTAEDWRDDMGEHLEMKRIDWQRG